MTPTSEKIVEWCKEAKAHYDVDKWKLGIRSVADYYTEAYVRAKTDQATEIAALKVQIVDSQNSLVPLARFGAMVAKSHSDGDFIDAEDLTHALIDSGAAVDTDGQVSYAPNIEATIEQLLKDENEY